MSTPVSIMSCSQFLNQTEADYMNLRLDTLETVRDVGESDETLLFWLKRDYVGLPFVTKHLPALKVGALPDATNAVAKRRKRFHSKASQKRDPPSRTGSATESSTDESEAKTSKPQPKQKAPKKKSPAALQYQGLVRKMRRGGY